MYVRHGHRGDRYICTVWKWRYMRTRWGYWIEINIIIMEWIWTHPSLWEYKVGGGFLWEMGDWERWRRNQLISSGPQLLLIILAGQHVLDFEHFEVEQRTFFISRIFGISLSFPLLFSIIASLIWYSTILILPHFILYTTFLYYVT